MPLQNRIVLSRDCVLKRLEVPTVYHIKRDELYEVDEEAFQFLLSCYNPRDQECVEEDFINLCLEEGILNLDSGYGATVSSEWSVVSNQKLTTDHLPLATTFAHSPENHPATIPSPRPSLRYLELLLTDRCNLRCKHCYLGDARVNDLALDRVIRVMGEFEMIQGLRLLLSGGEPLLHKDFWRINERLPGYTFRSVLLTNGTMIDDRISKRLNVHEVQVSLDGMEKAHDLLRGKGSFKKALRAIECLKGTGIDVSIATMVTSYNREDFPAIKTLLEGFDIKAWSIDLPCLAGNLLDGPSLLVPYDEAVQCLGYAYGGGNHGSSPGYACGSHLCAVTSDGHITRCGFFREKAVGSIEDGLEVCWNRLHHYTLHELACGRCHHLEACRGGCRFRAFTHYGSILAPDPLYCRAYGVEIEGSLMAGELAV